MSNEKSLISQVLRVISPLGEMFSFLSPLGLDIERDYDPETSKIKLHMLRALRRYLNKKNKTQGQEIATI